MLMAQFESNYQPKSNEFAEKQKQAHQEFDAEKEKREKKLKESQWGINTQLEADQEAARVARETSKRAVESTIEKLVACYQEIEQLHEKANRTNWMPTIEPDAKPEEQYPKPSAGLKQCLTDARSCQDQLGSLVEANDSKGYDLIIMMIVLWLLSLVPAIWIDLWYLWIIGATGVMIAVGFLFRYLHRARFQRQFISVYSEAKQIEADAVELEKRCLQLADETYEDKQSKAKLKHGSALDAAQQKYDKKRKLAEEKREEQLTKLRGDYEPVLNILKREHEESLGAAKEAKSRQLTETADEHQAEMAEITRQREEKLQLARTEYEGTLQHIIHDWQKTIDHVTTVANEVRSHCQRLFPDWDKVEEQGWTPSEEVPMGMPFGRLMISLDDIPDGVPAHDQLQDLVFDPIKVPALVAFPEKGSIYIRASGDGRAEGIKILQNLMLRCITGLPPAKVRFTIIDPIGLGENFSAFAHLADHDEKLVNSRIWTETEHIEKRLADLTEHIENVIQKYLRNQFDSLEEYNEFAGEVAEPYRILVISHLPAGFSEKTMRRLLSITNSGARCGVFTFIMVDESQPTPRDFEMSDLEQNSTVLQWQDDHFVWKDEVFGQYPLKLESPPSSDLCTTLMQQIGEAALLASRVEVPFLSVAPPEDEWWSESSRKGIHLPLGRAGATRRQFLDLGQGTSQHVLIAGKTGSGKSTLLHALIVQVGLIYTPEEVELYLLDFKKGVEFKTYVRHQMPHAKVVAIESEREFGLSVLQRLDHELKNRGEIFRTLGVNDIPGYRDANGEPLPRILLVVDEFQELFVEDDQIAQESALLLDRLVRQGRAFGIHVLLGSQTLGGAYSLARSTIDQMAVRIALQCSETDGHLILSKDNSAARLLSRPGEAIYNNANGLLEGNHLFQVVWLGEDQREDLLQKIHTRFSSDTAIPQIVFEGNAPAALSQNSALIQALESDEQAIAPKEYTAWLGDAIAIKEPTSAVFRRQGGSNLLMIGQQREGALATITSGILSIAAQLPVEDTATSQFLFVGDASEETTHDLFQQIKNTIPHSSSFIAREDLSQTIQSLVNEVDERIETPEVQRPPIFLCIQELQKFRDLRRDEDDFGFGRNDGESATPAKQFVHILKEGPAVGIFTLVWCDTLNNLQRMLDRQTLREFDMRVLFQMNSNDSSNLIDSPIASRLGLYRALFHAENEGRQEKFRPYSLPTGEWFNWVKERLAPASLSARSTSE